MTKGNYSDKDWLMHLPEAYAYHQIIVDQQGKPVDYVFLQVNPAFEEMTGLRSENILGKRVREVMPGIATASFNWIDAFGEVAQTGKKQYFKQYSQPLGRWYSVTAYSDQPGYFSVLFHDITSQQKEKENLQTILESTNRFLEEEGMVDHQQLVEDMKVITGAAYVAFHLFDENGKEFTTMAIAGISKNATKVSQILGFNPIGKKWAYDPVRQRKIAQNTISSFQKLKELSGEIIPDAVLKLLEKQFQIGQVTVINIKKKEQLIGDFTVLMAAGEAFANQEMALFYANQTGILLERERAMNQLKNQQDLFMAGPVFTIAWSPENINRVTQVSPNVLGILGYTPEEMTSETFSYASIVHPEDYEVAKREVVSHSEKGSHSYQQSYRLKTKGGSYRWFYDQTQCMVNQNGEVEELRGYLIDQTPLKEAEEQASKKQKELDRYFESSLDLLCIANTKGEFVRLNPEWGKVLGYPKEKLEGKLFLDFVHPDDQEKTLEAIQDLSNQREVIKFENRYRSADGSYRWIEWRSRPEGELIYAVARDITERIEYQEKLKEYQSRLSQAQLFTKAGSWEYDMKKSTLDWSPECEALFGLEAGSFGGSFEAFMAFVHPEDRDYVARMNQPVIDLKEGKSLKYEHRIIKATGEMLWVQETAGVIRDSKGEPVKITGFVMDITENKKKESDLREREKQLEMFFNQSFHGFFFCMLEKPISWNENTEKEKVLEYVLDHQKMTKVNQAMLDQYGAKEEDFIGMTVRELFRHDLDHAREIWRGLFDKGRWHVETKEQKMDGTPIIIDGEYTCLYDEKGHITGHFGVQMDVTAQKKAQQQLKDNEKRLEIKNLELKKASQEAQAATQAKSQFLANMSHEIRTPMNGILGFLQLLEETETNQQQSKYIDYIKTSSETLLILINDILDVSKIESGKMELESISFDLRSTIEDAIIPQSHRAHSKNIELHLYIHPDLPSQVKGDPTRIRQIISNLVNNAVKFTDTGSVTVECQLLERKKKDATVVMRVTDTGIGISAQAQQTLFNSFTQADPSNTREYGGSGLGLTITRDLVQLMKGDIQVKSALGEGSTFTVTLPLEIDKTAPPALVDHQLLKGKHIVIVDDTASNREMFRSYLEEAGCLVTEASRGSEAIEMLLKLAGQKQSVHGILIDQQMPGMSGDDLAIALKAIPDTKEIPLCLITSVVTEKNGQMAKEKGFRAYLTKPLRRRDLLDAVASIVSQEEERQQEQSLITRHSLREARDQMKTSVLVVEDQPVNRALAVQLLSNRGIRCEVAVNGEEAVEACRNNHYDLVLMDIQMPVMDGLEATRQIRNLDIIQQPRIAAMTAHAMKEDKEKCLKAGMDAYLSKPIDFDQVNALLQENMDLTQVKEETGKEMKPGDLGQQVLEKIIKDTGFDEVFASNLLKEGIQGCLDSVKTMMTAMEKDDFYEVKAQLHSIKGVASNLRLNSVSLWAEEGEKQAEKKEKETIKKIVMKIQNDLWEIAENQH